ncbi:MAG: V-type ATP synthase subunit E [Eubacteriaceae bacterium]|nr:V-type ATP synthase subunit E [Eubacteriaceae bacterium]
MSNLDNLIAKIYEDSDMKVNETIQLAKEEENRKLDRTRHEADREAKGMMEKSSSEAVLLKERIISNAHLVIRNEKLQEKQNIIDKVMKRSLEDLSKLDKVKFQQFVENNISDSDIEGDESILVNENCFNKLDGEFIGKLNEKLKKSGKKGLLKIEKSPVNDGFILYKNGIEINFTFGVMISLQREELEQELSEKLF